jgi:hypothetical protein
MSGVQPGKRPGLFAWSSADQNDTPRPGTLYAPSADRHAASRRAGDSVPCSRWLTAWRRNFARAATVPACKAGATVAA